MCWPRRNKVIINLIKYIIAFLIVALLLLLFELFLIKYTQLVIQNFRWFIHFFFIWFLRFPDLFLYWSIIDILITFRRITWYVVHLMQLCTLYNLNSHFVILSVFIKRWVWSNTWMRHGIFWMLRIVLGFWFFFLTPTTFLLTSIIRMMT